MPFVLAIARQIGLMGCVVVALLLFYEGIPGLNYITPLARFVPAIGPMIDDAAQGRVGRERAAAVAGFVTQAEVAALRARLAQQERLALAASQSLEEHRKRLAAAQVVEAALSEKLDQEITENEKRLDAAGRACRLDDADIEWLRKP